MSRILHALEPVAWIAATVLFINWITSFQPDFFNREVTFVSGWWWFSILLIAAFLSEYNSRDY